MRLEDTIRDAILKVIRSVIFILTGSDGEIDHSEFYDYVWEFEVAGNETVYPYVKMQGEVSLSSEVDLLRQAVYELRVRLDEVCFKDDSYNWC